MTQSVIFKEFSDQELEIASAGMFVTVTIDGKKKVLSSAFAREVARVLCLMASIAEGFQGDKETKHDISDQR